MATGGDQSAPNSGNPSKKSSTAGVPTPNDSNRPEASQQPDYSKVDPSDPLSPEQLRRHEMTTGEALEACYRITRIAKHPETEPAWPAALDALRKAASETNDLLLLARALYEKQRRYRDLTSQLDMKNLENINAADDAEGLLLNAWRAWRDIFWTYQQIHAVLAPNKPLRADGLVPPTKPDPGPAPAAG
jgi:hypothetical protein